MSNERQDPPPASTPRRPAYGTSTANTPGGAFEAWTRHNTPQHQGRQHRQVQGPPPVPRANRRASQLNEHTLVTPQHLVTQREREVVREVHEDNIWLLIQSMDNILRTIPPTIRRRWLQAQLEIEERSVANGRSSPLSNVDTRLVSSPSNYQELFKPDINF